MGSARIILALAAALFSASAAAQFSTPRTFYAGASVGSSNADRWCSGAASVNCDDTSAALKAFGGYQLDHTFAVEVGYVHLGTFKASAPGGATDEAKVRALEGSIVAAFPIAQRTSLFGRFGGYYATVREDTNFAGASSNNNTDLTFGFGVRYDVSAKFAIRAEWQRYLDVGGPNVAFGAGTADLSSVDVLGVGALWRF
ncbi:MAG: outer membrane beta-barrel protein [Burkholderiales bacterium]